MINPDRKEVLQEPSTTDVITHTIRLLRKIRGATEGLYVGDPDYTPAQRRQFLVDAEQAGSVAAGSLMVSHNESVAEKKDEWLKMMGELSPKYAKFKEVSRHSLDPAARRVEVISDSFRSFGPSVANSVFQRGFQEFLQNLQGFGTADVSVRHLTDNRLVIFSPLAADYLIASLLHRFTDIYLSHDCFRLKPIILDRDLRPVAIPNINDDLPGTKRLRAFVENSTSGQHTLRAVLRVMPSC